MGLDHVLAFDHVAGASHADRDPPLWGPYTEHDPFHDPMVMFAYLAGMTQKIEFVTGVLILPQRQTVLLAKQATDLDLLSGERLRLGVGTGWNYVEYEALGQDFQTRGARMDEQIDFLRKLWAEPLLTFEGRFDRITRGEPQRPARAARSRSGWAASPIRPSDAPRGSATASSSRPVAYADPERCLGPHPRIAQPKPGRSEATFGRDYIALRPAGVDDAADCLKRWRDAGGTHGTIASLGRGFTDIQQHIDLWARSWASSRMTGEPMGSMGVRNYLIEGVSCTGKTSVCGELRRRGLHAINGDAELAYQGDPITGEPGGEGWPTSTISGTWIRSGRWWPTKAMRRPSSAAAPGTSPVSLMCSIGFLFSRSIWTR